MLDFTLKTDEENTYVFELDVSEFAELVDCIVRNFSWDDELYEAHRL